jgi:nucleoid-associated protein YgaU
VSLTYTVTAGDTLSGIATWFEDHGYQDLYAANRAVIGSDPDLIRPGQQITITRGVMTVTPRP